MLYMITWYEHEPRKFNVYSEEDDDGEFRNVILSFFDSYGLDPDECPHLVSNTYVTPQL